LKCGTTLTRVCAACRFTNEPAAEFCGGCGARLETTSPATVLTPDSYTPKHLADKILTSKAALEGERKQVTVLFADVVESSRLAGRLDPEAMHEVMDRVLRLMAGAVHRYEGTVNQFLGDGLMALFGAPLALEDHALRAVRAALAIQETIAGLGAELIREHGVEVHVRVGLNTGPVVVGRIGDDLRMDYTAIGDTTHLAARMQQAAEPGAILAAEGTHRLVEGHVVSEGLGAVAVKGRSGPVVAHRIVRERRRTRLQVGAEHGLTALVGRRRELDLMRERFEQARDGRGQIVGIVGEPGVGKSRLAHELRASLQDQPVVVLEGACVAYAQATPYTPIAAILRASFGVDDGDDPLQIEEKLRQGILRADPALLETAPSLRELVGLPADAAAAALDPKARRQRTFEAIRALTMAASRRRPHVVIVEDLHWIDPTSEDYLAFAADSLAAMPVLLVTTSRPGHAARWADRAFFTQIALDVLDERGTAEVLAARLGTRELPAGLARLVHAKAEGNPLFVEEISRSLMERGLLVRTNGGMTWVGAPVVELPATGQDIIRARIDQLPEPVKRTLQTAAVIGRQFSSRLLARVAEVPDELDGHLDMLRRLELVRETRFVPDVEYTFKHALIQDVAYEMLLVRRRRALHVAVGRAIEELEAARLPEMVDVLAHHFASGEERGKALAYLIQAGDRAATAFGSTEAGRCYQQALALVDDSDAELRLSLLHRLVESHFYGFDPDTNLRHARQGLELALRLGDRRRAMAMHLLIGGIYIGGNWDGAREDEGLEHLEAAAAIAEDDPDSVSKGLIYQRTAHLYLHRAQPATAADWARRGREVFARIGAPIGTCHGTALSFLGHIDEGAAYNEANWETVRTSGNLLVIAIVSHELGLTFAFARHPARTISCGERALPAVLGAREANPHFESIVRRPLALAYTLAGRLPEAAQECARLESITATTWAGCPWEDAAAPGFFHLRAGELEAARRVTDYTLGIMTERSQIAAVSGCSFILGSLDLAEGKHADALANLRRALDICRQGGGVLFELWVLPVLCELYLATGQGAEAAACVDRGFELLVADRAWYGLPAGVHLARALLARGRRGWEEAEASFARALAINRAHALAWDEAKAELEWARMLRMRGRASDNAMARERLDRARAIFERAGARREMESCGTALLD
jgi:class 3 adenylate cyclase/tetratricopeptide (TPR) repeat protein